MNAPSESTDPRIDRLYNLLPAIYRIRDSAQGYPLQALLRVIAEQVNVVEDNISQLYQNWFIETCEDWAVPYIGDLVGYRPALDEGEASSGQTAESRRLNRILIPRREVANTIRYRRRKGALYLLDLLANDIAGWPARSVEFYKLLGWNQNVNHLHLHRAQLANLRTKEALDLLDGPFDKTSHTVDVRRISSHRTLGRYNIPSVGVFIWRLNSYPVTKTPAYCDEETGPQCFTFSVLGQDTQLYNKPEPKPRQKPTRIAEELNLPVPIRRLAFADHISHYYGEKKSFAVWAEGWADYDPAEPVPAKAIRPADLSNWQYVPPAGKIAVDPLLGRLAFPLAQLPKKGVRVSYHYGFSADLGGGEYPRPIYDSPPPPDDLPEDQKAKWSRFYRVGRGESFKRINDALKQWSEDKPIHAVIELENSAVYVEPIQIALDENQSLQLRAADAVRPVIRLIDYQTDKPDALEVRMAKGGSFALDGVMVTGRPVQVTGPKQEPGTPRAPICPATITIRHCTFVPGWGIDCGCEPRRPAEPSLELYNVRAKVIIEHSILGSIQVHENEVTIDPIPLEISDSIIDATDECKEVIGAPGYAVAHAVLTIKRCTLFGIVQVNTVNLAENCIFNACVNVAHRQVGCMRFCYSPPGCRTPRRYHCQPDLVVQAVQGTKLDLELQEATIGTERLRVKPQFNSNRYGKPDYAQLSETCADEIKQGADDRSEMGVFHDLFQPQRAANLLARLQEYTPAGMDVGLIDAT